MKWKNLLAPALAIFTIVGTANAGTPTVSVSASGAMKITGTNGLDIAKVVGGGAEGMVQVLDVNNIPYWAGYDTVTSILFIGKGGRNKLVLDDVWIAGPVNIRGGTGIDVLNVKGTLTAGRLEIEHGNGNNELRADGDTINLDNGFTYESGSGKDEVIISELNVVDDNPADIMISTGGGKDTIDLDGYSEGFYVEARQVLINAGPGNDTVRVYDLDVSQGIQVFGAAGNDKITIDFNFGASTSEFVDSDMYIDAIGGPGKDTIKVRDNSLILDINVNCGADNDKYLVSGNDTDFDDTTVIDNCEINLNEAS